MKSIENIDIRCKRRAFCHGGGRLRAHRATGQREGQREMDGGRGLASKASCWALFRSDLRGFRRIFSTFCASNAMLFMVFRLVSRAFPMPSQGEAGPFGSTSSRCRRGRAPRVRRRRGRRRPLRRRQGVGPCGRLDQEIGAFRWFFWPQRRGSDQCASRLMALLGDEDGGVRWGAAEGLGNLGAASSCALRQLQEAVQDEEEPK